MIIITTDGELWVYAETFQKTVSGGLKLILGEYTEAVSSRETTVGQIQGEIASPLRGAFRARNDNGCMGSARKNRQWQTEDASTLDSELVLLLFSLIPDIPINT